MDINKKIALIEETLRKMQNGEIPLASRIGQGRLPKGAIANRSITANMISVSSLSAIHTETGNLSVTGSITMEPTGSLLSGKSGYSDTATAGIWIGYDSSTLKLRMGNAGHTSGVAFDGTNLLMAGTILIDTDVNLKRGSANLLQTDDQFYAADGIRMKTKAGIPSDSDTTVDAEGVCILDSSNSRFYIRVGSTWKYAALT